MPLSVLNILVDSEFSTCFVFQTRKNSVSFFTGFSFAWRSTRPFLIMELLYFLNETIP